MRLQVVEYLCKFNYLQGKHMFHIKDRKTGQLFDQWRYLGPKRRKLLDESWAGLFREKILSELPVERMSPFPWGNSPAAYLHLSPDL